MYDSRRTGSDLPYQSRIQKWLGTPYSRCSSSGWHCVPWPRWSLQWAARRVSPSYSWLPIPTNYHLLIKWKCGEKKGNKESHLETVGVEGMEGMKAGCQWADREWGRGRRGIGNDLLVRLNPADQRQAVGTERCNPPWLMKPNPSQCRLQAVLGGGRGCADGSCLCNNLYAIPALTPHKKG